MNSFKFLCEVFLPEARFPDEKFWNKDGSPIHPEPKGAPHASASGDDDALDADELQRRHEEDPANCPGCGYYGSGHYPEECPICNDADDELDFSNDGNSKAGAVGNYGDDLSGT